MTPQTLDVDNKDRFLRNCSEVSREGDAHLDSDDDDSNDVVEINGEGGGEGEYDAELESEHFVEINERPVKRISMELFYKPRTITLLFACVAGLTATAFVRDGSLSYHSNLMAGFLSVVAFFMVISILAFPNGPFTRPHPVFWRMLFGASVFYLMLLQFLVHQDYATVKSILLLVDPGIGNYTLDMEKTYGTDCWDVDADRLYSHLDVFAFGHLTGWAMKAIIVRHYGICWSISVMWELTEMAFGHLLPNFYECWWDNIFLDVIICNGLGIWVGMQVCHYFEMREHHWESFKNISSKTGRVKRVLLQFTPESWTHVRWMDPECSWMRFVAILQMMLFWQVVELNTFFVKHVFPMPPAHPICVARMLAMAVWAAPSARQYYSFVTDPRCKRLGTQCWVYICIGCSELVLNLKFGREELFSRTEYSKMAVWIALNVVVSCLGLAASMKVCKWRYGKKKGDLRCGGGAEKPDDPTVQMAADAAPPSSTSESEKVEGILEFVVQLIRRTTMTEREHHNKQFVFSTISDLNSGLTES